MFPKYPPGNFGKIFFTSGFGKPLFEVPEG
jgi:hypothetical protein